MNLQSLDNLFPLPQPLSRKRERGVRFEELT